MNGVEQRRLALSTGRLILSALVDLIDAELVKISNNPSSVPAPPETTRGRSKCRHAVPKSALVCPKCGVGVYRARNAGDATNPKKCVRICDDCGYRAGTDQAVKTKAHRRALLVQIGERIKARNEEEEE